MQAEAQEIYQKINTRTDPIVRTAGVLNDAASKMNETNDKDALRAHVEVLEGI